MKDYKWLIPWLEGDDEEVFDLAWVLIGEDVTIVRSICSPKWDYSMFYTLRSWGIQAKLRRIHDINYMRHQQELELLQFKKEYDRKITEIIAMKHEYRKV